MFNFGNAYRVNHLKESLENWPEDGVNNAMQTFMWFESDQDNGLGVMTKTPTMCNTCVIKIHDFKKFDSTSLAQ